MKKLQLTLMAALFAIAAFAQNDKMFKHTGEKLEVKIVKVGDWTINFTYPNETAEQTISKYAVAKIEYASGRKEDVTEKIVVSGEDDWEKVVILEDKSAATGLKKLDEVKGKTAGFAMYQTAGTADKKSTRRLKQAAAQMGAPFVLLTSEKDNQFTAQAIKKGIAYSYK